MAKKTVKKPVVKKVWTVDCVKDEATESVSKVEKAMLYLESCFKADPKAIRQLFMTKVKLNGDGLVKHPDCLCYKEGSTSYIRPIGLINGMLKAMGFGQSIAINAKDKKMKEMLGFCMTVIWWAYPRIVELFDRTTKRKPAKKASKRGRKESRG